MPSEGPGSRHSVIATKATAHNKPATELGIPGVAAKSAQAAPAYPSVANALAAQNIDVGEEFVIMTAGLHVIASSLLPGGAAVGTDATLSDLYIKESDNSLALAATALNSGILRAGWRKFGKLVEINTDLARASVNLNLRSTF